MIHHAVKLRRDAEIQGVKVGRRIRTEPDNRFVRRDLFNQVGSGVRIFDMLSDPFRNRAVGFVTVPTAVFSLVPEGLPPLSEVVRLIAELIDIHVIAALLHHCPDFVQELRNRLLRAHADDDDLFDAALLRFFQRFQIDVADFPRTVRQLVHGESFADEFETAI